MNALSLYVTTCRMVLQSGADDASAWADISRLLSCLRQTLTCCVCEKILTTPTSSSASNCNHNVCKGCIGGKIRRKPVCDLCSDFSKFTENIQVRIILQCYKKLCEYIVSSALHRKWGNLNGGTRSSLGEVVQEGAELACDYRPSTLTRQTVSTTCLRNAISNLLPSLGKPVEPASNGSIDHNGQENALVNGNGSVYSVSVAEKSTKIMIKRTNVESSESEAMETLTNTIDSLNTGISVEVAKPFRPKKRGCRCGLATRNPGQLTCCGQRCLCYVDRKACNQCRCRGCRNPNKYDVKSGVIQISQPLLREMSEIEFYIENTVNANGENAS